MFPSVSSFHVSLWGRTYLLCIVAKGVCIWYDPWRIRVCSTHHRLQDEVWNLHFEKLPQRTGLSRPDEDSSSEIWTLHSWAVWFPILWMTYKKTWLKTKQQLLFYWTFLRPLIQLTNYIWLTDSQHGSEYGIQLWDGFHLTCLVGYSLLRLMNLCLNVQNLSVVYHSVRCWVLFCFPFIRLLWVKSLALFQLLNICSLQMIHIYISMTPSNASNSIKDIQGCLSSVQSWMSANKLKLNPDKTEFIVFGNKRQQAELAPFFPADILGNALVPAVWVKNLGVKLDLYWYVKAGIRHHKGLSLSYKGLAESQTRAY